MILMYSLPLKPNFIHPPACEIFPPNYAGYRHDRNIHGDGGTCIAVKSNLVTTLAEGFEIDCEITWCELQVFRTQTDKTFMAVLDFSRAFDKVHHLVELSVINYTFHQHITPSPTRVPPDEDHLLSYSTNLQ